MQHCSHVARYYFWKSKQYSTTAQSESNYWRSNEYGLASFDAHHAANFFKYK